jgi:hypothetical protein
VKNGEILGDPEFHSFQSLIPDKDLMLTIEHAQRQTDQIRQQRKQRAERQRNKQQKRDDVQEEDSKTA